MISLILGTQWGDEGKGKIVDLLSSKVNYVVRFHGGNNAGHTVIINKKRYPFHLLPSGILNESVTGIISNGVIIDLGILISEIKSLERDGFNLKNKLVISPRCHLIMPYHKELDQAYENARGKNKLGTTKKGIGPTYADKVSYNGIRLYELINWKYFEEKFRFQAKIKNKILKLFKVRPINIKKELKKFKAYRSIIKPYVHDTYQLLQKAVKEKKDVLFEGAHGVMLDNDWSPYPFCTGSNVITGAVNIGSGVSSRNIGKIIGVVKTYLSRVGGGPLPTELKNNIAKVIREKGKEYGTTTGRPRRIGWLDLEAVKFACQICQVNSLALTKIDVLSGIKELKIAIGYKLNGKRIKYSQCGYGELSRLKPIYKSFEGWKEDISKVKKFSDLPNNCKKYLKFIESFLKIPLTIISNGADRSRYINI